MENEIFYKIESLNYNLTKKFSQNLKELFEKDNSNIKVVTTNTDTTISIKVSAKNIARAIITSSKIEKYLLLLGLGLEKITEGDWSNFDIIIEDKKYFLSHNGKKYSLKEIFSRIN